MCQRQMATAAPMDRTVLPFHVLRVLILQAGAEGQQQGHPIDGPVPLLRGGASQLDRSAQLGRTKAKS